MRDDGDRFLRTDGPDRSYFDLLFLLLVQSSHPSNRSFIVPTYQTPKKFIQFLYRMQNLSIYIISRGEILPKEKICPINAEKAVCTSYLIFYYLND